MILSVVVGVVCPLEAQISVSDLQAMEGPWECRTPTGIAGVFISGLTTLTENSGQQDITSQAINVRVYQRQGEQEHSGYFSPTRDSAESTDLANKHLIVRFKGGTDIPAFDLDVRFDAAAVRWTGLFSLCDKSQPSILSRPLPREGVHPSIFVGNWKGFPDPNARFGSAPGTLLIRQSYDGRLTAWLDRTLSGYDPRTQSTRGDQRNGEWLVPLSFTENTIVLETTNSVGMRYRYEGMLSGDGKNISGQWLGGRGGTLNAPTLYRRVEQAVGSN